MKKPLVEKSNTTKLDGEQIRDLMRQIAIVKKAQIELQNEINALHNSLSWKMTLPFRSLTSFLQTRGIPVVQIRRGVSKVRDSVRIFGFIKTAKKIANAIHSGQLQSLTSRTVRSILLSANEPEGGRLTLFYPENTGRQATDFMVRRVLIIAEMSIPQCKKYRVDQKAEHFERLGIECEIVNWVDYEDVRTKLQTHPLAIFYRVPAVPDVVALINEAKRLGVHTFWEVDDLIFDPEGYLTNTNLDTLDQNTRKSVLSGMQLYREALLLCDGGLASTSALAKVMSKTTGKPAFVIENALDFETLQTAREIRETAQKSDLANQVTTIVYGSGTKTHDIDFLAASDAIYNILNNVPNVKLRIIGELNIHERFNAYRDRIERLPFTDFNTYLHIVSQSDISIAPLEQTVFNDAKSNIKFLEASVLGLPSVCSPTDAYRSAILDGHNGFLAATGLEWEEKLLKLINNPALRTQIAANALHSVMENYSPERITEQQLAPIIDKFGLRSSAITRILLVNVYFSPQSFGGATIVAEEMAQHLAGKENVEIYVFTSWPHVHATDYSLVRYDTKGSTVFALKVPAFRTPYLDIEDDGIKVAFQEVLKTVAPDIVNFHSIQTLGVTLTTACDEADIPYVITLHDAWWLCERQFMVTGQDKFCFQTTIDPAVCANCVVDRNFNEYRTSLMRNVLPRADGLIAPSAYFKKLHVENGLNPDQIFLNKNGIKLPGPLFRRTKSARVRFGYVGGSTPIKGYDLIKKAFASLPKCDAELVMVDNTLNQGFSSVDTRDISPLNPIRIVPAYTQESIDDFFAGIDVLLFPTQWKESFGLTVREALIRDIWVIASDAGGVIEDIIDGMNGAIIPITSEETPLRHAMQNIIDNKETLRGYVNPNKHLIQSFEGQGDELYEYLIAVIHNKRNLRSLASSNNM